MGFIYRIDGPTDLPEENKTYIGLTIQKINARWSKHKGTFKEFINNNVSIGAPKLCEAAKEFGTENFSNFSISVIEECDNLQLNDREIYWINELNTTAPNGYNISTGGGGYRVASDETRANISLSKKTAKSIALPIYINYYERDGRHGYRIRHDLSNNMRTFTVPDNEDIPPQFLDDAIKYLEDVVANYNSSLNVSEEVSKISIAPVQVKRSAGSSGLPLYINVSYSLYNGVKTRHGYEIVHTPSKKKKIVFVDIDKPLTEDMLVLAKAHLLVLVENHADSSSQAAITALTNLNISSVMVSKNEDITPDMLIQIKEKLQELIDNYSASLLSDINNLKI